MNITTIILIFSAISLALYDIYALWRWGYQGTISYVVLKDSKSYPIIAFICGLIAGHLWWPQ